MALSVRIDPIDRDIAIILADELGPEARSKALANFARSQLAQAQETNRSAGGGVTPPHETFVDGRNDAVLENVKPDGTIVFEFDLVNDALDWIGEQLVKASPVLTGAYARSHIMLADGVEVAVPGPIPLASRYTFLNIQPYSRKIEGVAGRAPQSDQAPDGVYQAVAVIAKGRFGNVASIKFSYQALIIPARGAGKAEKKAGTDARQPAIIVSLFGGI